MGDETKLSLTLKLSFNIELGRFLLIALVFLERFLVISSCNSLVNLRKFDFELLFEEFKLIFEFFLFEDLDILLNKSGFFFSIDPDFFFLLIIGLKIY